MHGVGCGAVDDGTTALAGVPLLGELGGSLRQRSGQRIGVRICVCNGVASGYVVGSNSRCQMGGFRLRLAELRLLLRR